MYREQVEHINPAWTYLLKKEILVFTFSQMTKGPILLVPIPEWT